MLAEYHLNVLEKLGLITSNMERGYRCFFPVRAGPLTLDPTDKKWLGLLRRPPILGITLLLLETVALPAQTIGERLTVPLSTTLYQLKQMETGGLVVHERIEGRTLVRIADPGRVLELLRSYHPTPDAITRYAELWDRVLQAVGGTTSKQVAPEPEPESNASLPVEVRRAPQSVRTVYDALLEGPLTGQELVFETGLARRTVYAALAHLKRSGLLGQQGHLKDMRQTKFWIPKPNQVDSEAPRA